MFPEEENKKVTFFVDAMLGNVARKLRLLGYDSKYFSDIEDEQIIVTAKEEDRIIISKDENLIKKAKKLGMKPIFIMENKEIDQFLEIISQVNLNISQLSGDTARCPKCNSYTELVDKESIKGIVPEKVYQINLKFWRCNACNQVYWEGTHIKNLQKFLGKINERL